MDIDKYLYGKLFVLTPLCVVHVCFFARANAAIDIGKNSLV
jgi:hypothetical protein